MIPSCMWSRLKKKRATSLSPYLLQPVSLSNSYIFGRNSRCTYISIQQNIQFVKGFFGDFHKIFAFVTFCTNYGSESNGISLVWSITSPIHSTCQQILICNTKQRSDVKTTDLICSRNAIHWYAVKNIKQGDANAPSCFFHWYNVCPFTCSTSAP